MDSLLPSHQWSPVYSLLFIKSSTKFLCEYVLSADHVSVWGCVLKDMMVTESGVVPSLVGLVNLSQVIRLGFVASIQPGAFIWDVSLGGRDVSLGFR